jgi:thioredoxin 1
MDTNTSAAAALTLTDQNFAGEIERSGGLSVVDFWAAWCGPCRRVGPVVEQLAADYAGRVKVGKVDVDANPATAARFGIRSIPAILFFKDGALVDTVVGAAPKPVLERLIQQHL